MKSRQGIGKGLIPHLACSLLLCQALLAVNPASADTEKLPSEMKHIKVKLVEPALDAKSFAAQPRDMWIAGTKFARVEEAPDYQSHIQQFSIIAEPDAWMLEMISKRAKHSVDPGPTLVIHIPLFGAPKTELGRLEFGKELQFFKDHGAKPEAAAASDGKTTAGAASTKFRSTVDGTELTLLVNKAMAPLRVSAKRNQQIQTLDYLAYEVLKFDPSRFRLPPGFKVEEARAAGKQKMSHEQEQAARKFSEMVTYYYMHPQPEELIKELVRVEKAGVFDSDSAQGPITAMLSQLFQSNPARISDWTATLNSSFKPENHRIFLEALWLANNSESGKMLKKLGSTGLPLDKNFCEHLSHSTAVPILKEDLNPGTLDELWGCFLISGQKQYLRRIMDALLLARKDNSPLSKITFGAASWSLASNCKQHEVVMKYCQEERDSDPNLREYLSAIIKKAEGK